MRPAVSTTVLATAWLFSAPAVSLLAGCSGGDAHRSVVTDGGGDGVAGKGGDSSGGRSAAGGAGGGAAGGAGASGGAAGSGGKGSAGRDALDASLGADAGDVGDARAAPDARDAPDGHVAPEAGDGSKVVFVTSAVYTGDLGGLPGADGKCQRLADAAKLGGSFRAWLSDASGSPATRFTHPAGDYVLADRTTVFAHGWAGLTGSGTSLHALDRTELNGPPPASLNRCAALGSGHTAWVSTNGDGTAAPGVSSGAHTCSNWTTPGLQDDAVGFGEASALGSFIGFCSTAGDVCTGQASLFCFEQ